MIQNILARLAAIAGAIIAIFTLGNFYGRKSQQTKQLEENFNDAVESKNRQENRRNDDISAVRKRMQKYIRK
ncbi:MAG: hypothetical protein KGP29_05515 [Proteobacteria bacterium]|nr:hypothetical protein [Pseudomonadota bacterium]